MWIAAVTGIVDESDLLLAAVEDSGAFRRPVKEFMTTRLTTVSPATPLRDLLPLFERGLVPIVLDGDTFVGLVTRIDWLNYLRRRAHGR